MSKETIELKFEGVDQVSLMIDRMCRAAFKICGKQYELNPASLPGSEGQEKE